MKDDILRKIEQTVNSRDYNEQAVMYVFVEIRKLTEQIDLGRYQRIFFMADWVVHYKMSYRPTQELLKKLESSITPNSHGEVIFGFASFQDLRVELIGFLENNRINTDNFQTHWQQFLESLVDIISDCPLENLNGTIIKRFFVTNRNGREYEYHVDITPGSLANINPNLAGIKSLRGTLL